VPREDHHSCGGSARPVVEHYMHLLDRHGLPPVGELDDGPDPVALARVARDSEVPPQPARLPADN
jgi:hypothetical protein